MPINEPKRSPSPMSLLCHNQCIDTQKPGVLLSTLYDVCEYPPERLENIPSLAKLHHGLKLAGREYLGAYHRAGSISSLGKFVEYYAVAGVVGHGQNAWIDACSAKMKQDEEKEVSDAIEDYVEVVQALYVEVKRGRGCNQSVPE